MNIKYNLILIFTLLAFVGNAASAMITNEIYDVVTLTFEAQQQYTNFSQVQMKGIFNGPNGEITTNSAFWNGENQWAIRLFPTSTGVWNYVTSSIPDAGLNNHTNSFEVVCVQSDNPLRQHGGILKVSANKRYLTYTDGTPFFWLGDTWWFCPSSLMPFDTCYKKCIDTRTTQDYSIVQFAFLGSLNGSDPRTLIKQGEIDPEYWQEIDRYINYANYNGIVVVFGLTFHSGMDGLTLLEWEKLWDYAIARYSAHAVTFLICGEYNQNNVAGRVSKVLSLGQYIKNTDPYKRAMTVHPWWYAGEHRQAWNESWYDFVMLQGAHEPTIPPYTLYTDVYFSSLNKPILESECRYEGIRNYNAADVREVAYRAIQYGSFGYTYGSHGLWYPTQNENDHKFEEWGTITIWSNALIRPGGYQMKILKSVYESCEWWKLEPKLNVIDSSINQEIPVKADGNKLFVIYFPDTYINFYASLTGLTNGDKYKAKFFNTRTGEKENLQTTFLVNNKRILLPERPSKEDWILILNKIPVMEILNPSFESPVPLDNWSCSGTCGVDTGLVFSDNGLRPDLDAVAYIRKTGQISQNIFAMETNKQYWLQFRYNVRASTYNCNIAAYFGTQELMRVTNLSSVESSGSLTEPYYYTNVVFIPYTNSSSLIFKNLDDGIDTDRTALFDGIVIIQRDANEVVIKNPGFEATGVMTNVNNLGQVFNPKLITGWEPVSWYGLGWSGNPYSGTLNIPQGNFCMYIVNGCGANQTITGLEVGYNYRLSYYFNARPGNLPHLQTKVGDLLIHNETNIISQTTYYHTNLYFTATSTSTVLQFESAAGPDNTVLIDDISIVNLIPEPVLTFILAAIITLRKKFQLRFNIQH